ncbi:hypothetical protein [Cohnella laeviribosi]|uniref:hypothetical protein n=1 Tax=Cohnella laeviribosi TaxID=380174 RepID=UPI0012EC2821|nr:hypothetical protein [Cohnella laeviribosi]
MSGAAVAIKATAKPVFVRLPDLIAEKAIKLGIRAAGPDERNCDFDVLRYRTKPKWDCAEITSARSLFGLFNGFIRLTVLPLKQNSFL